MWDCIYTVEMYMERWFRWYRMSLKHWYYTHTHTQSIIKRKSHPLFFLSSLPRLVFSGGSVCVCVDVGCHLCSPEQKCTISLLKQTHKHSQGICVLLVFSQSDMEPLVQRKQKTIKILKRLWGLCLLLLKGSVTV